MGLRIIFIDGIYSGGLKEGCEAYLSFLLPITLYGVVCILVYLEDLEGAADLHDLMDEVLGVDHELEGAVLVFELEGVVHEAGKAG